MRGWFNDHYAHSLVSKGYKVKGRNQERRLSVPPIRPIALENGRIYQVDKNGIEVRMKTEYGNYAHIYHLFIPKDKRQKGLGTKIINKLQSIAEQENSDILFVTIDSGSGAVESFMKNLGFERGHEGYELDRKKKNSHTYHKYLGGDNE